LKTGLLGAAVLALFSLPFTKQLPHDPDPAAVVQEAVV
jgi:hypothetical protein